MIEYLPGDENFGNLNFYKKFNREYTIGKKAFGTYENKVDNYFIYYYQKLRNRKTGQTELYEYISFDNILNNHLIVFLKFETLENYNKWRKNKPKKGNIKKIYKLENKIQVNLEIGSLEFFRIQYFNGYEKIGLNTAKQIGLC